jgi:hypothetical protein
MTTEHLSPERIAAYLAHKLSAGDRDVVEKHLTFCKRCRGEVVGAARFQNKWTPRRKYMRFVTILAAAALVVLVLSVDRVRTVDAISTLRSTSSSLPTFETVSPVDGGTANGIELRFVWRAEQDEPFYDLHVLDAIGDEVWAHSTADTSVLLAEHVHLEPGQTYFWFVDALLRGVQTSTTGIREFTVTP